MTVLVEGSRKVGNFALSFTDLQIPLAGIPITVRRVYDSRDRERGDFGIGWRLQVQTMEVTTNSVLGAGWEVVKSGLSFELRSAGSRVASVRLPDGRVESFAFRATPPVSVLIPFSFLSGGFVPLPGTRGSLEALDGSGLLILDPQPGPVQLIDDSTFDEYDPQRFRYTTPDGTQIVLSREGVETMRDPNGNTLTITPAGIVHSTGASVAFVRDAQDRIVELVDPAGNAQRYAYDADGDLAAHTDGAGHVTRYLYDRHHHLLEVIDPLGRAAVRTEYDDAGRVSSITDAEGHTTLFEHRLAEREELVTDARGNTTLYAYDERGNVLAVTDATGATTAFTYDGRDNLRTLTDPLGHTVTYSHDANDHLVSVIDALGVQTVLAHDGAGRLLSSRDPLGRLTEIRYDARGNPLEIIDPGAQVTALTYDASGNLRRQIDPVGSVTSVEYDSRGLRSRLVDPTGQSTALAHDANGNLLSQDDDSGGSPWRLGYDPSNQLMQVEIGGAVKPLVRDAAGRVIEASDSAGRTVRFSYDEVGRALGVESPDGTQMIERTYDVVGNLVAQVDPLGGATLYAYDAANRLTETTFPDGSKEQRTYDLAGRLVGFKDRLGRTTSYHYDATDRLVKVIDALGGETRAQYDAVGNVVEETDPLGRVTRYHYDALDRLVEVEYADGTSELRTYDGAGRLLEIVDPAGNSTRFAYDALGRLLSTTDALGQATTFGYARAANPALVTDARGNTTRHVYDDHGRETRVIHPLGQTEDFGYDHAGRLTAADTGAGLVRREYDARGWLERILLPDGSSEAYEYAPDGLTTAVTDARGTTSIAYDVSTRRILRVTEPDGAYVRYEYDAIGHRTLLAHAPGGGQPENVVRYTWDELDRLTEVIDPDGGVTVHSYDAAGNLVELVRPNGVKTELAYDLRSRLVSVLELASGGAVLDGEQYTLDAAGNRRHVDRSDGRKVEYDYDALYRVVAERHFGPTGVLVHQSTYAYDAVGNRVQRQGSGGAATFVYDANNQLLAGDGVTYLYDDAGRRIEETRMGPGGAPETTRYAWDTRDRLVRFEPFGDAPTHYQYDAFGRRIGRSGPAGPHHYLVDSESLTGFGQLLSDTSPTGPTRSWIHGARLLQSRSGTSVRNHHLDALGSTRLLTDAAGSITDLADYLAFGTTLQRAGASDVRHLFAGENSTPSRRSTTCARATTIRDRGLPHARSRLGRSQPSGLSAPVLYAHANPVNRTDPSGQTTLAEQMVAQAIQAFNKYGQTLLNVVQQKEKAERVVGESMRYIGGALSIFAIQDAVTNPSRPLKWFGGALAAGGRVDLSEYLPGVTGSIEFAASALLVKTAIDLLGAAKVDFEVLGSRCGGLKGTDYAVRLLRKSPLRTGGPRRRGVRMSRYAGFSSSRRRFRSRRKGSTAVPLWQVSWSTSSRTSRSAPGTTPTGARRRASPASRES